MALTKEDYMRIGRESAANGMPRPEGRPRMSWQERAFLEGYDAPAPITMDGHPIFQDAAGTIPVTAIGQPVGRVGDKVQAVPANRPILAQHADGRYGLDMRHGTIITVQNTFPLTPTERANHEGMRPFLMPPPVWESIRLLTLQAMAEPAKAERLWRKSRKLADKWHHEYRA